MIQHILKTIIQKWTFKKWFEAYNKKKSEMQIQKAKEKKLQTQKNDFVRFETTPLMADEYEMQCEIFQSIFNWVAVILSILLLIVLILFLVDDPHDRKNILIVVVVACFIWLIPGVIKFLHLYMKKTKCLYFENRICIKRFLRRDKVITYEELTKYIHKKKIKVRNGRFELPYKWGFIPVYTWGGDEPSIRFYRYINKKCKIRMPEMLKNEEDIVRRTGIGMVINVALGLPFLGLSLFCAVLCVLEYGLEHNICEIIDFLINNNVVKFYFGLVFFIWCIGSMFKIYFYFPARKRFKNFKDIIRVKMF